MNRTLVALAGLLALGLTACGGGGDPLAGGPAGTAADQPPAAADVIRVGSANFTESRLLAEIYSQALEARGVTVERQFGIGSREVYFPALQDGSIDLIPEYTGNLLQEIDPQATATASDQVYQELTNKLPDGLIVLEQSAAEDKDAVVITQETAQRYNARSIADLAPHCGELVFGGPPEFAERPYGLPGIERLYGCKFAEFRSLDAGGPLTVAALTDGSIQAADLFTTDPTIATNKFVVLEDPENLFASQNVTPLIYKSAVNEQGRAALNAVSAKLTTQDLLDMMARIVVDKDDQETVAKDWLTKAGLAA
jgi:osmoprotectant transport system substrate-binding protein